MTDFRSSERWFRRALEMLKHKLLTENVALSPKLFLQEFPESPDRPVMMLERSFEDTKNLPSLGYRLAAFT